MPAPALSLFGFLAEERAINYLANVCVEPDCDPGTLRKRWQDANRGIGKAFPSPGRPSVKEIPPEFTPYLGSVTQTPRFDMTILGSESWAFKLVEIAPLLAMQFHVETERSAFHCDGINDSDLRRAVEVCLPLNLEAIPYNFAQGSNSVTLQYATGNLRVLGMGKVGANPEGGYEVAGIAFGASSPLVHVVEVSGRYYLANGFHRAYGLGKAGITHVPCIVLHCATMEKLGPLDGEAQFSRKLLESANPPTLRHFIEGRATEVQLRRWQRIITVTWSEASFPVAE